VTARLRRPVAVRGITHDVRIDREHGVVTKRFRSWARDEPAREWAALRMVAESAAGLAARPISASLGADPPEIRMSWLPGEPLGAGPVSPEQAQALARSLDLLWRTPPGGLAGLPAGEPNPEAFTGQVRRSLAEGGHRRLGGDPVVCRAAAAAAAWLERDATGRQNLAGSGIVLGQGDANLANFLWDGRRVRLVDFEDSGPSDRAFELAILVEHLSAWSDARLDADAFASSFELTAAERVRLLRFRRLAALFWLLHLRPGGRASRRNPPGTLRRQAERLLALLG
jgi:Ser/Thr protein kinase RdoA (MazF antagonist)